MPLHDFECVECGEITEENVSSGTEKINCPHCGCVAEKRYFACAKTLTTIIPDYPGCKKKRAGYVHTHGDRPATKTLGKGWSPPA